MPDAWQRYWKDPSTRLVQSIGKDNVPFHKTIRELDAAMEECSFQKAIRTQRSLWQVANIYFDRKKPWAQVKSDRAGAALTLTTCAHLCRSLAVLAAPFLPSASQRLYRNLAIDKDPSKEPWSSLEDWACMSGHKVTQTPIPLFDKIEDAQIAVLKAKYAGAPPPAPSAD